METIDKSVTVQLHRSDFTEEKWESLKHNTYWYDVLFIGKRIIRILTWESNYYAIQEMYNFK